jgi:hypothetical protein
MTLTEQYYEYVKECIKERPAFSGPYEDYYLEFDQWIDKYMIEFAEWCDNEGYTQVNNLSLWKSLDDEKGKYSKELLEIFKKEKGL